MTMISSNSAAGYVALTREAPDAAVPDATSGDVVTVDLETKSDRFVFSAATGETFLMSALAAGHDLPYECATGSCGTCHARVMQGAVDPGWTQAPGYATLRRDKGDILMCQARPSGDCVLRVRTAMRQPAVAEPRQIERGGRVSFVRRLTGDVVRFDVTLSDPMDFEAGQFVTLQAPGLIGRRAYSMVNFARGTTRLQFVVKRKPGGGFSDWLFDKDPDGAEVGVWGPLGRATFRPESDRNLVCVAGGSGVAGMIAIMRRALESGHFERHRGLLVFGVRTLADGFHLDELAEFVDAGKGAIETTLAISHEDAATPTHPRFPQIAVRRGMAHEVAAAAMAGRWADVTGFVAGPQPMVDATLRVFIAEGGLASENIRFDKFS